MPTHCVVTPIVSQRAAGEIRQAITDEGMADGVATARITGAAVVGGNTDWAAGAFESRVCR